MFTQTSTKYQTKKYLQQGDIHPNACKNIILVTSHYQYTFPFCLVASKEMYRKMQSLSSSEPLLSLILLSLPTEDTTMLRLLVSPCLSL